MDNETNAHTAGMLAASRVMELASKEITDAHAELDRIGAPQLISLADRIRAMHPVRVEGTD